MRRRSGGRRSKGARPDKTGFKNTLMKDKVFKSFVTPTQGSQFFGNNRDPCPIFWTFYREGAEACPNPTLNRANKSINFHSLNRCWPHLFIFWSFYREGAEACPHPTHARPHPALRVWQMRWRYHLQNLRFHRFSILINTSTGAFISSGHLTS